MIGRLVGIYEETCCSVRFVCVKYCGGVDYVNLVERKTLRDRIVMLLFEKFQKFLPSKEEKGKKKKKM